MKKPIDPLEAHFWSGHDLRRPLELLDAFFDYAHLDEYKEVLSGALLHTGREEVYHRKHPGDVFLFYTALRSFVKASYRLSQTKKWQVKEGILCISVLHQASLDKQEYADPLSVFRNAFATHTSGHYENFLCELVHLALCPYDDSGGYDLLTPYLQLVKMLDAAQLIRERGVERVQKGSTPAG
ncbi:hypothetical protein [Flavobacterium soli]|uniref:hypothetical protein n=1 Tax=Flavobacterium soli TaxID=344881 RepID=UPI0012F98637|nr:hypothetical protein [Flavobacterium soli]